MTLAKNHAIVLGAGMAGLLSARVLSQHFTKVTVVDKDSFPTEVCPRKGVAQAMHLHVLLRRGLFIIQKLFPRIEDDLITKGAVTMDWGQDTMWLNPFGWTPRFTSEVTSYTFSRWMLEHTIRKRVVAIPQVVTQPHADYKDIIIENGEVRGVRIEVDGELRDLHADFVVDATGKNSKTIKFLDQYGFPAPRETRINSHLGYASRHYQIPEGNRDWKQLYIQMNPPQSFRGGVLQPIEENRWIATLIGANKDYPPGEENAFLEFAKSLRNPMFYEAIRDAEPLSRIYCYRNTESRLRHFAQLKRIPANLVCLGDSVCAFNPVYGQGMTVSALAAQELDHCFRQNFSHSTQLCKAFYQRLHRANFMPWLIASSEDNRIAAQNKSFSSKLIHGFFDRVLYSATQKPHVHQAFLEVLHMTKPALSLAHPRILFSLRKKK